MQSKAPRHHYIDWLRISAFMLLILYHGSRAFFPEDPWHISNPQGSWVLRAAMDAMAQWRLPLLFFISGIGSWFVMKRRSLGGFVRNRLVKVLLPLGFSMLVIVPPQVWLERRFYGQTDLGYPAWLFGPAFAQGTYPEGNISWHHLWYLAYLLAMSLMLIPLIYPYVRGRLHRLSAFWARVCGGPSLLAVVALPLLVENTAGRMWPGASLALLGDWGWLAQMATWFTIGFLSAPHLPRFAATAKRFVWFSGAIWLGLTLVLLLRKDSDNFDFGFGDWSLPYDDMLRSPIAWFAILTLVGLFVQVLNRDSGLKRYLATAVYPLYIIHQTLALTLVYLVVPLDWPVGAKLLGVTLGTFLLSFATYHLIIRNLGPLRPLFGLPRQGGRL